MTGKISEDTRLNIGEFDGTEDVPVVDGGGANKRIKTADLATLAPVMLNLPALRAASPIAVANDIGNFRAPFKCTLTGVKVYADVAPNALATFDLHLMSLGISLFSTKPTIDSGEKTSVTAATAAVPVLDPIILLDDEEVRFDITGFSGSAGSGITLQALCTPYFGARLLDSGDNGTGTSRLLFKFDANKNDSSANAFSHSEGGTVTLVSLGSGVSIGTDVLGAQFHNTGDSDQIVVSQAMNWAGAFTLDAWVICNDGSGTGIAGTNSGNGGLFIESGVLDAFHYDVTSAHNNFFADPDPFPIGVPTHVALINDGAGKFQLWVNGVKKNEITITGTIATNEVGIYVGSAGGFYSFNGIIAQWRWTPAVRWTATFVPPTNFT